MESSNDANRSVPETGDLFRDISEILRILRGPGGCPWDRKQDLKSGVKDLLSEAKEVRQAMEMGDMKDLKEELGDLLWATLFTINIAHEMKIFDLESLLKDTKDKMIRRHPHVFGGVVCNSDEEASRLFQKVKEMEKDHVPKE